jgi:hypothetical protein
VALVRKRTIPTERPPLVGEVSANFCGGQYNRFQWPRGERCTLKGTTGMACIHNHVYIETTIDCVGYKRKATDNFVAEARKQDNELGLGIQNNTRGQPVKN